MMGGSLQGSSSLNNQAVSQSIDTNQMSKDVESTNVNAVQVETEPGEINDESTACGCRGPTGIASSSSLIPAQNIQRLKQSSKIITMKDIIYRHLRDFVRGRFIKLEKGGKGGNHVTKKGGHGSRYHRRTLGRQPALPKRQKSSDVIHH